MAVEARDAAHRGILRSVFEDPPFGEPLPVCRTGLRGSVAAMADESRRAPDPFRPGGVPEGEPFAKAGRPAAPMLVIGAIVLLVLALVLIALAR